MSTSNFATLRAVVIAQQDVAFLNAPLRRRRSRLRKLGVASVVVVVVFLVAQVVFGIATRMRPPPALDGRRSASGIAPALQARGPRSMIGENWISKERGIWEIHLAGDPYSMGLAHARLANPVLLEQEDFMFSEFEKYVPSSLARRLIRLGVMWRYRHLGDSILARAQAELAGLADGMIDRYGDFLPAYERVIFYHSLHDITQGLEGSPMLGCTAMAASGSATPNGHLIIGRNFDFEGPEIFDREKAVLFFRPEGQLPFVSIAWAGMAGVVTGINSERIYVSVNAARSDDKGRSGMPIELLLRQVMEEAHSIADVVRLVRSTPVMVPDFYLVGDGKTGEAVVLERTPRRLEVRRLDAQGTLALSNHALSPSFSGDAENDRLKRYLTSGARYRRAVELLQKQRGNIDPRRMLEMLRDKRGVGGEALGLGNRNALDAIIATHSVVVDATAMMLWVGEGPHALGRYRAFDIAAELQGGTRSPPVDLPADPIADSDELRNHRLAMAELKLAERLLKQKDLSHALEEAERAVALDERSPEAHKLLGDILQERHESAAARSEYQRFLELNPPHLHEVETVRGILTGL